MLLQSWDVISVFVALTFSAASNILYKALNLMLNNYSILK